MLVGLTVLLSSLGELVKDGVNGLVFKTPDELADQMEVYNISPKFPRGVLSYFAVTSEIVSVFDSSGCPSPFS